MKPTITITEGSIKATSTITYSKFLQIMCNGMVAAIRTYQAQCKENPEAFNNAAFDATNKVFSAVLEECFPDILLRPDLTEEAILQQENILLKRKASKQAEQAGQAEQAKAKEVQPNATHDES